MDLFKTNSLIEVVETEVSGECTTRSGKYAASKMTAYIVDNQVSLSFVSKTLKRAMQAVFVIKASDMDAFCLNWIKHRKLTKQQSKEEVQDVKASVKTVVSSSVAKMLQEIDRI